VAGDYNLQMATLSDEVDEKKLGSSGSSDKGAGCKIECKIILYYPFLS
jgi:hypothetical protein